MRPRPPACCKAARSQLITPYDTIWVSDELLFNVFQRFCCVSRTSRRHGSFVPGPMEARRRLGNRRMTHISGTTSAAPHNVEPIWGFFGEPDRTKWQWQAPTPRPSTEEKGATFLPTWLLEWNTTPPQETTEVLNAGILSQESFENPFKVEDEIRQFRQTIKTTTGRNEIAKILAEFAQQFRKSINLGLVSQETLDNAINYISEDLRTVYPKEVVTISLRLAFYTQVWDGIVESKVLQVAEIEPRIMSRLFSLVVSLPLSPEMRGLAKRIIDSATDVQLHDMETSLTSLVEKWTRSWLRCHVAKTGTEEYECANLRVAEATKLVTNVQNLIPTFKESSSAAQKTISEARVAISKAMDAVSIAQDVIFPLQASVKDLARILDRLPAEMLVEHLPAWSEQIIKPINGERHKPMNLAYSWLCVLARLQSVDYKFLIQTWRQVDPGRRLHLDKCASVILEHWISQGKVTKPSAVWNAFDASVKPSVNSGPWSFARLLLAIDVHREMSFARTKDVFDLLHKIGRQRYISEILGCMKELRMKIPTTILAPEVQRMSNDTTMVQRALNMWKLAPHEMKVGYALRPDFVPGFIINLINSRHIQTKEIWKLLNIPFYKDLVGIKYQPHLSKPLPQEMIDLMHKMAVAFAHSEARSLRVALRNITQCIHHLRVHHAPISPDLARAVNHCVTTKPILQGSYVSQERLRYCLYLISNVEGEEVAKEVDRTVNQWRRHIDERRMSEMREANVLRGGQFC